MTLSICVEIRVAITTLYCYATSASGQAARDHHKVRSQTQYSYRLQSRQLFQVQTTVMLEQCAQDK